MANSINELKTEWTKLIYPGDIRDSIADEIGLSCSAAEYDGLENALYWLKATAENPYNNELRILWEVLQIMAEKHPAEIPF